MRSIGLLQPDIALEAVGDRFVGVACHEDEGDGLGTKRIGDLEHRLPVQVYIENRDIDQLAGDHRKGLAHGVSGPNDFSACPLDDRRDVICDQHIVLDDDSGHLWNLLVGPVTPPDEPVPVASNHDAVLQNHAVANRHAFADGDVRVNHAVAANRGSGTDGHVRKHNRVVADGRALADCDQRPNRNVGSEASVGRDDVELPSSIEGLLSARIDALPPHDRALLRRVAVLGPKFAPDLLPAVLEDVPADDDPLWERLGGLLQRDPSGIFRFPHSLVRDVAYEGLPYRLRRSLHAQVGEQIEHAASDRTAEAERLSFHFFRARRYDKAWTYSRLAGDHARALYANLDATHFYERALESARALEDLDPEEMASVWEALGEVWQHIMDYAKAANAYRSARRIVKTDPVSQARLLLKQGILQGWLSKYSNALQWIRRGLRALEGVTTREAARQRAQLTVWYARFCAEKGRHAEAITWCHRAVEHAIDCGERDAEAHAYRLLDWAHARLGQLDQAIYSSRALAIYEELEDLAGQNAALNNMAILMQMQGRWADAVELLQRMLDIAETIGDELSVAIAKYNMGDTLCDQGRLDEAEVLIGEALRIWQAAGERVGVATAKRDQGRLAARLGQFDEALRLFEDARGEFEDIGARFDTVDTQASQAEEVHAR